MIEAGTIFLFYDDEKNCFYNTAGIIVVNIFAIITPNDLYLFHQDNGFCTFRTPWPGVYCEICTMEEGWYRYWF